VDERNPCGFKVKVYTDKETGANKGEGTIAFASPDLAKAAIEKFNGQYFPGSNAPMRVMIASYKPSADGGRGGGRGGGGNQNIFFSIMG
jgi:hypothetical protein